MSHYEKYLRPFLGATAMINSRTWGPLLVESASFTPATDGDLVIHIGDPFSHPKPLVRIHSECVFAEAFDSDLCDCGDQLLLALDRMVTEGNGLLFYLRFDGRGAGLAAKVKATALEVEGLDTYDSRISIGVPPEGRNFRAVAQYLIQHKVQEIRLLSNSPSKLSGLRDAGLDVDHEPLIVDAPSPKVQKLLHTKATRFGHLLPPFDSREP